MSQYSSGGTHVCRAAVQQGRFLELTNAGVAHPNANTDTLLGVATFSQASGKRVGVVYDGVILMEAGAAVAAGAAAATDNQGRVVTQAGNATRRGTIMEAGSGAGVFVRVALGG